MTTTSEAVRGELIEALRLDLVGPDNGHLFAQELLPEAPSRWCLTGFLVPTNAPLRQRADETAAVPTPPPAAVEGADDSEPPDRGAARRSFLPSSMGLTVLVAPQTASLQARVSWGDYSYEGAAEEEPSDDGLAATTLNPAEEGAPVEAGAPVSVGEGKGAGGYAGRPKRGYRHRPRESKLLIALPEAGGRPTQSPIPASGGLCLVATCRTVQTGGGLNPRLQAGTKSVSLFLVNERLPVEEHGYRAFAFQTELALTSEQPLAPRPDLRGGLPQGGQDEWDEQVADLHYGDVYEYAVGHGVSATAEYDSNGVCHTVKTTWLPTAEVERVAAADIPGVELGMEALGALADGAEATARLGPLVEHYGRWIEAQQSRRAGLEPKRQETAQELLTLDQLGRASALICALELEREKDPGKLGHWPFEIGLWVGSAATPNRMGCRGDQSAGKEYTAYTKVRRFTVDSKNNPSPIPLENCPWCGERFDRSSFRLMPNDNRPLTLEVRCVHYKCEFSGDRPLPIVGVDEPIYRRLPAFLIATVDKFAALPWTGETGALFGLVERYDKNVWPARPPCGAPKARSGRSSGGRKRRSSRHRGRIEGTPFLRSPNRRT